MRRTIFAALCPVAAFFAASIVHAQEDAVVVTAKRFPEARLDAPVGMTVITAQDIAGDTARTLPEVLSHFGGLQIRNNSGSPDQQIDLRGFGITGDQNTLVLIDGVRINESDLSSNKLSSIPLQSVERIEILRGSGSVQYGDNAVGGTINIITRGPKPGRSGNALVGAGSYGTYDARASTNVAGERSGITASAQHLESDNYRANNRLRQDSMAGDMRFTGDGTNVGLKFGAETQRLQLPGDRTEAELQSDPRGTRTPGDWSAREGAFATASLDRSLGRADVAMDLGYREKVSTAYFAAFAPTPYSRLWLNSWAASPRLRVPFAVSGVENVLVIGLDRVTWDFDRRATDSLDNFGSTDSRTTGTQDNTGAYAQYSARFATRTKLTLGAREQRVVDHRVTNAFVIGTLDQTQVQKLDAQEIGLSQGLGDRWEVYAKDGTNFRVANVDENGFTQTGNLLKAQTGHTKEAGVEYRGSDIRARLSAYRITLDNEIYFSALTFTNINLSPTHREGIELFASTHLSPSLDLSGNVIAQRARFREGIYGGVDVSGRDVPLVPRTLANVRASWRVTGDTALTGTTRYVGRQRYDNDQANLFHEMPTYSVTDLKVSHRQGRATWALAVNNVFDKRYYSYAIVQPSPTAPTTFNAYPEVGRNVMATLELSL